MTEEELSEFIKLNSDRIKEAAIEACIEKIKENVRYSLPSSVQEVVNDFMKNDVAPAVAAALKDQKSGIIKSATAGAAEIGDKLAKMMVENATKNLSGYRGGEIIKDLFK